ncbi:MAG: hypothetical protein WDZ79_02300 [Candidatus Paceibacterota bacterium]
MGKKKKPSVGKKKPSEGFSLKEAQELAQRRERTAVRREYAEKRKEKETAIKCKKEKIRELREEIKRRIKDAAARGKRRVEFKDMGTEVICFSRRKYVHLHPIDYELCYVELEDEVIWGDPGLKKVKCSFWAPVVGHEEVRKSRGIDMGTDLVTKPVLGEYYLVIDF